MRGLKYNKLWIGWPGLSVKKRDQESIVKQMEPMDLVPVFLCNKDIQGHYHGFSNTILWPLHHYMSQNIVTLQQGHEWWKAYERVNKQFAEAIIAVYRPGDLIWVHDFHLFLVPGYLRQWNAEIKVGFFLHIPFPSSEVFKILPWRENILSFLLSCDLIGFHTQCYERHFKSSVTRLLGKHCAENKIDIGAGCEAQVGTFPIGIDPTVWLKYLSDPVCQKFIKFYEEKFADIRVILGVDRLDYTKGLPHKLLAFERFLEANQEWAGKCVMVQIAVPSRQEVEDYKELARHVHEIVGRINGRFGTFTYVPVHLLDTNLGIAQLCALYRISDTCLCTSIRDGMNLVSYEFIVCQPDPPDGWANFESHNHKFLNLRPSQRPGVLILSEFTGAAQSLGSGVIRVNPWNVEQQASALKFALEMADRERWRQIHRIAPYINRHTAQAWADSFLERLKNTATSHTVPVVPHLLDEQLMLEAFANSKHRLIMAGLVGTVCAPMMRGVETVSRVTPHMTALVNQLHHSEGTTLVIMSGRMQQFEEEITGDTEAWLVAENGYYVRKGDLKTEWNTLLDHQDISWMADVKGVLDHYVERTPGSYVKVAGSYLTWNYRLCEKTFATKQAMELYAHLTTGPLAEHGAKVVHCNQLVQVRPGNMSKGLAFETLITSLEKERGPLDFILCLGDFMEVDEDVYEAARKIAQENCEVFTCAVREKQSRARWLVKDHEHVTRLFEKMVAFCPVPEPEPPVAPPWKSPSALPCEEQASLECKLPRNHERNRKKARDRDPAKRRPNHTENDLLITVSSSNSGGAGGGERGAGGGHSKRWGRKRQQNQKRSPGKGEYRDFPPEPFVSRFPATVTHSLDVPKQTRSTSRPFVTRSLNTSPMAAADIPHNPFLSTESYNALKYI